jgi:dTDP-4-dehydrorhamnose 3,5-epimerase
MSVATIETPRFSFIPTPLPGVWQLQRKPITDTRGFFSRFYCADEFSAAGFKLPLVQINHSYSKLRGTLRGMHFQQPPHAETKIVTCIAGRIFDVAVDLRRSSATFLQWVGAELSAENQQSLIVPPGFAHGFQTLSDDAEIIYLVTAAYSANAESGINPRDPAVNIQWPEAVSEISARDAERPGLDRHAFRGLND